VRCLNNPVAAFAWIMMTIVGWIATMRGARSREASKMIAGTLSAVVIVVVGASDPVHARYFVPVLALSSGFVVAAAAAASSSLAIGVSVGSILLSATVVAPQLAAYRTEICPALLALNFAANTAGEGPQLLVVDHTLISFVNLTEATRQTYPPIIYDNQIEAGEIPPPPPKYSVAVHARGHAGLLIMEGRRRAFSCQVPIVRTIELGRFLDVTVSTNPVFEGWVDDGKPYIVINGT
jgi:hypothetical protein